MTQMVEVGDEDPRIGVVDRPLYSTGDREIEVEPGDEPILREIQRELPYFLNHDFDVYLSNGDYTGHGSAGHLGPCWVKGEAQFKIQGNPDDPDAVHIDGGINGTFAGKFDHIIMRGLFLDGITQFDRGADVRNCIIHGNGTAAISGKAGRVRFVETELGGPDDDHAVWLNGMHQVSLRGCTLGGTESALHSPLGGMATVEWSSLTDDCPRFSEAHRRPQDGVYFGGRRVSFDD